MSSATGQNGRWFAYASEFRMDITTLLGLVAGAIVLCTLILMGGDFRMFYDIHAVIIIFGGSFAATLIRFPLSAILHGMPLGAKFAFTMSRLSARDLVDELARIAEIARKQGPVGLEKVEADKLHGKLLDEETNRTLIIDGILMIRDSKSPALVREMLLAYLPEKHRHEEGELAPA